MLSPWVLDILDLKLPRVKKISSIIESLFERTRLEPGETIAYANTSLLFEGPNCDDPDGRVLEVSECKGNVWIRFNFGNLTASSFELYMHNRSKDE